MMNKQPTKEGRWQVLEEIRTTLNGLVDRALACPEADQDLDVCTYPPIDMLEDDDRYLLSVETPGLPIEQLSVNFAGNAVTIAGEKPCTASHLQLECHRAERVCGLFKRTVPMPGPVDGDGITAHYANGLLSLVLPKAKAAKAREIVVAQGTPPIEPEQE